MMRSFLVPGQREEPELDTKQQAGSDEDLQEPRLFRASSGAIYSRKRKPQRRMLLACCRTPHGNGGHFSAAAHALIAAAPLERLCPPPQSITPRKPRLQHGSNAVSTNWLRCTVV